MTFEITSIVLNFVKNIYNFGITPKRYLKNLVMRKISTLLFREKNTLRAVADELRFSSDFYLSRFIRKNAGIPVSQFRKQLQQYPGEW